MYRMPKQFSPLCMITRFSRSNANPPIHSILRETDPFVLILEGREWYCIQVSNGTTCICFFSAEGENDSFFYHQWAISGKVNYPFFRCQKMRFGKMHFFRKLTYNEKKGFCDFTRFINSRGGFDIKYGLHPKNGRHNLGYRCVSHSF